MTEVKTASWNQDRTTHCWSGTWIEFLSTRLGPSLNNDLSREPESKQVMDDLGGSQDYPPEPVSSF